MIMIADLDDIAYLAKVAEAIKAGDGAVIAQLTTKCPECDEIPDGFDADAHIALTTAIPGYWEERGDWGQPNSLGMTTDDPPFVLIGCEGYHLIRF